MVECLVKEAYEKCQCEECLKNRKWTEEAIARMISWEITKVKLKAFENSLKNENLQSTN